MPVKVDSSAVRPSGTSYGSSFYGGSRSARIWFGRPGRVFSGSRIGSYVWRVLKVAATSAGPCRSTIRTGRLLGCLRFPWRGSQPARCRSKRTRSRSIAWILRSSIRATTIRAIFGPRLCRTRSYVALYLGTRRAVRARSFAVLLQELNCLKITQPRCRPSIAFPIRHAADRWRQRRKGKSLQRGTAQARREGKRPSPTRLRRRQALSARSSPSWPGSVRADRPECKASCGNLCNLCNRWTRDPGSGSPGRKRR